MILSVISYSFAATKEIMRGSSETPTTSLLKAVWTGGKFKHMIKSTGDVKFSDSCHSMMV